MRILVTGSREFGDRAVVAEALVATLAEFMDDAPVVLVHGACPSGADRLAAEFAKRSGWTQEQHHAAWRQYGKRAGPMRNQRMVDKGADVCLAFFKRGAGNRGTANCVGLAEAHGIPVRTFWEGKP